LPENPVDMDAGVLTAEASTDAADAHSPCDCKKAAAIHQSRALRRIEKLFYLAALDAFREVA